MRHRSSAVLQIGLDQFQHWAQLALGVLVFAACPCLAQSQTLPLLMQSQPESVQKAWFEIAKLMSENEKLKIPLADPYLARAELWVAVGSHEDALRDYLTATELLVNSGISIADQAEHLRRLRTALDQLVQRPRPYFPNEAMDEFRIGMDAFRANRLVDATWRFEESCRLDGGQPLYRIYRGLAYQRLGRTVDANREIAVAVSLIRHPGADTSRELKAISSHLESVQGPLRNWLNAALTHPPRIQFPTKACCF